MKRSDYWVENRVSRPAAHGGDSAATGTTPHDRDDRQSEPIQE